MIYDILENRHPKKSGYDHLKPGQLSWKKEIKYVGMAQLTEQFRPLFLQYNLCLGMIDCRFLAQISSFELMICEKLFVLRARIVFFCNQGIFH